MDLKKTGKYIAGKRKEAGLTQKQLAEQLGMSDKSVSKWERGICLPDVSVYMELCGILGISINEFLAGEDISEENMIKKSEDNLIRVTEDSERKQRHLKRIIAILSVIALLTAAVLGIAAYRSIARMCNYIAPVERDSAEMKTAELLSGTDGTFLFRYYTEDPFQQMGIYLTEYHEGKLIARNKVAEFSRGMTDFSSEGMIALIQDFEKFEIRLIAADSGGKYTTAVPILENVENRAYYGRTASQIEKDTPIKKNTEQGLVVFSYGADGVQMLPVENVKESMSAGANEFIYYFSVQFCSG